ncbi:MAG TPA: nuclear transport factor 2 family protein [Candidatus Binataceae bacterium]|nr:nuclear transport factor 2 family protein [Candidatus Binataceae bacterium]
MTEIEKIHWLIDRERVRETVACYPVAIDSRDWKLFRSIFTDEIEVLLTVAQGADRPHQRVNADRFTESVTKVITSFAATQHFLTDYRVTVAGDTATCLSYMYARHIPPKDRPAQAIWDLGGYYEYHLKRSGNGWKIPKYSLIITWETNRPRDLAIDLG